MRSQRLFTAATPSPLPARITNHRWEVNLSGWTGEDVITDNECRCLEERGGHGRD